MRIGILSRNRFGFLFVLGSTLFQQLFLSGHWRMQQLTLGLFICQLIISNSKLRFYFQSDCFIDHWLLIFTALFCFFMIQRKRKIKKYFFVRRGFKVLDWLDDIGFLPNEPFKLILNFRIHVVTLKLALLGLRSGVVKLFFIYVESFSVQKVFKCLFFASKLNW